MGREGLIKDGSSEGFRRDCVPTWGVRKMRKFIVGLAVVVVFSGVGLRQAAPVELVSNGDFEGGSYNAGFGHTTNDLAADTVPNSWVRVGTQGGQIDETFWGYVPENSLIAPVADNGPSAPGSTAMEFLRTGGGSSGDYTMIRQSLDIYTEQYVSFDLSLDVKALSHDLCGGGSAGGWEYPIAAVIKYEDSGGVSKRAHFGWYLFTSSGCDATEDWMWWPSTNTWAKSRQVTQGAWSAWTIDLLDPTLDIAHITDLQVGGSGWNFESRADNVSILGVIPEPSTLLIWSLLAALGIGWGWWRRKE